MTEPPLDAALWGPPLGVDPTASRDALDAAAREVCGASAAALATFAASGRLVLDYGGPFDAGEALRYLGRDPANAAERVAGDTYRRHLPTPGGPVAVTLTLAETQATLAAPAPLAPVAAVALARTALHLLGLRQPLPAFQQQVADDPVLGPLTRAYPGVRTMQVPVVFEALCWAIIGQQINLAFAYRLRNRLIHLGNGLPAQDAAPPEPLPFPPPAAVAELSADALREVQFSRQKAEYVLGLARAFADGPLGETDWHALPSTEVDALLLAQRGLGPWSVAYVRMRALADPDVVPAGDAGLRRALQRQFDLADPPDAARQEALLAPYAPHRSLATTYLWRSLAAEMG